MHHFTIILVSAFKQGAEGRYLGGFVSVAGLFVYFYIKDRPKKIKLSLRSYFTNMKLLDINLA